MDTNKEYAPKVMSVEECRNAVEQKLTVMNSSENQEKCSCRFDDLEEGVFPLEVVEKKYLPITTTVVRYNQMTFDRLKIAISYCNSKSKPFVVIDKDAFKCCYAGSNRVYYRFDGRKNHLKRNLQIKYGQTQNNCDYFELVIEFTSTILGDRMMELISSENIRDCLRMLDTKYHLIRILDIEDFIRKAYVLRCDVTIDKRIDDSFAKDFADFTSLNRGNAERVVYRRYSRSSNFYVENNVDSNSKCKMRLTFYDKYKKMKAQKESGFPLDFMTEKYRQVYRLEMNLISVKQIKEYLHVRDNLLWNVLACREQPILSLYKKYVCLQGQSVQMTDNLKSLQQYLLAKNYQFDIEKIELVLRQYIKPWQTKHLTPYRIICCQQSNLLKDIKPLIQNIIKLLSIEYEVTQSNVNLLAG